MLKVTKTQLKNIGPITMKIGVNEKLICVELSMGIFSHKKEILKNLNKSTANNINAIPINLELATV